MRKKIESIVKNAAGIPAAVSVPENHEFGHYSTNVAMRLAKEKGKNPMDVAAEIVEKIEKRAPRGFFDRIEIAAPGFVNLWVSERTATAQLAEIISAKDKYGRSDHGKKKKIILDYSSPNIAKPMHVGHLRSTVIGDALANIHEYAGYKVIRWNYVGDWGTQFGKLIAAYKRWGNKKEVEKAPINELLSLYVRFHKEEAENPVFAKEGRDEFMKLESGDRENRKLWAWFRKESMKEFAKIYAELGIKFDVSLGEAFFEPYLKPLIERLYKKKIAVESEGALVVPLEANGLPPALIQKSDESSLYLTRDIANLEYRIKKYKPAGIIYVVSNEQTLHFSQLFAVAETMKLGRAKLSHVKFGLVLGEKGKKLSTRSGEAIRLDELIGKGLELAGKTVNEKGKGLKAAEKAKIAAAVAIGAVKYNDLRENRLSDIYFDWDKMLDFTGDSAPYLQYTHARLKSILRKGRMPKKAALGSLKHENEMALIRKMAEFPFVVVRATETLAPNAVAKYLYDLANAANKYYESTPILKDEDKDRRGARLALISSVSLVLKNGLGLLGIKAPDKI